LMHAGVVAATDQATATEDLFGMSVMAGITDSGGQMSNLNIAEPLEFGSDEIGSLGDEINQTFFHHRDALFNCFQEDEVVIQQFAADGNDFFIRE
jgi:hypothetical protein